MALENASKVLELAFTALKFALMAFDFAIMAFEVAFLALVFAWTLEMLQNVNFLDGMFSTYVRRYM
jgi:hypothetical protein